MSDRSTRRSRGLRICKWTNDGDSLLILADGTCSRCYLFLLLLFSVVPNEYGILRKDKWAIGVGIARPLFRRMIQKLESALSPKCPSRVTLYFSSESHIHALRNVLLLSGIACNRTVATSLDAIELNYLRYVARTIGQALFGSKLDADVSCCIFLSQPRGVPSLRERRPRDRRSASLLRQRSVLSRGSVGSVHLLRERPLPAGVAPRPGEWTHPISPLRGHLQLLFGRRIRTAAWIHHAVALGTADASEPTFQHHLRCAVAEEELRTLHARVFKPIRQEAYVVFSRKDYNAAAFEGNRAWSVFERGVMLKCMVRMVQGCSWS
jgi:hypothetical protein